MKQNILVLKTCWDLVEMIILSISSQPTNKYEKQPGNSWNSQTVLFDRSLSDDFAAFWLAPQKMFDAIYLSLVFFFAWRKL